ncbi:hypothetical protein BAUCODRAFT_118619 [Baudoinia panamericana UAMH 10762]|uniref:Uncharacterized protein n=1 Tax=Baudoinia panamericana (strain UAMH 10762) TaxID=717646 RepID=M2MVA3_BAUPA|nr:uncharacterized protein BAUCODRAFT_118619 [Baudoinia panamericana UAMH 10762]EMD00892.1 hypothetical protein BAUCODRAFT_118619 [Baudoinia panamericana UAMH 10762]
MASLRLTVPRATLTLHSKQLQQRLLFPALRQASNTTPPPKPRLLEKPERFNPPSHGARLRTNKPKYYGPALSEHERTAQKTRRYPHMMPPEGSFMHWFLTDRSIHLYISLGILVTLVGAIWYQDFISKTPYRDLLPPNSLLLSHPISFLSRWAEVYQMHVAHLSAETAERRRQKTDDVKKRAEYRKAHGLDDKEGLFSGWTLRSESEPAPTVMTPDVAVVANPVPPDVETATATTVEGGATYIDFEGKTHTMPARKKWFGIW